MDKILEQLFSGNFMPHGMCYLWRPAVLWLNVLSDGGITLAYLSIPVALLTFIKKREDLEFSWIYRLFAAFIFWCAMTHIMDMWIVWHPDYAIQGFVKLICAMVSITTAVMLWPLIPKAVALPSPTALTLANNQLREEIMQKEAYQLELQASYELLEKRVEERTIELKRLNEELARSNADLEDFAHIASHDLKEPLRGIQTYADYIGQLPLEKMDSDIAVKMKRMQTLASRMQNFIDSLMLYSKVGMGDLAIQEVNLNDVIRDISTANEHMFTEKHVTLNVEEELPTVRCDGLSITQMFQNLIINGIKYNDNREIRIDIGYIRDRHKLKFIPPGVASNDKIYYIRDNGIGIRSSHHEKIFKIFKRLHTEDQYGGGSGAGLTIVKRILERHGGVIWLDSEQGQGTIFYFTLPERNTD